MSSFAAPGEQVYLVFGKNGWIGGMLIELLTKQGKTFHLAESRTYNRESVLAEVEKYKPTHILNAAGVTGRPNVDWCEDNKVLLEYPLLVFIVFLIFINFFFKGGDPPHQRPWYLDRG